MIYSFMLSPDPYHCGALLNGGQWIDPPKTWQPPGCMMRTYAKKDLTACHLGKVTFIGDSTVRKLFWATAEKLDPVATEHAMHKAREHGNITFARDGIDLSFVWDPYLNTPALHNCLEVYHSGESGASSIMVIGGGLWHAKYLGERYLQYYGDAIDRIVPFMNPAWPDGKKEPYTQSFRTGPRNENLLILAPVHTPRYEALSPDRAATMARARVNPMNDYLRQLSKYQGAHVAWSWSSMVWQQPTVYQEDGLHILSGVAEHQMDIVLNMRCNSQLSDVRSSYPMDNTCCIRYAPPSWVQRVFLMFSLGILPLITVLAAKGKRDVTYSNNG